MTVAGISNHFFPYVNLNVKCVEGNLTFGWNRLGILQKSHSPLQNIGFLQLGVTQVLKWRKRKVTKQCLHQNNAALCVVYVAFQRVRNTYIFACERKDERFQTVEAVVDARSASLLH